MDLIGEAAIWGLLFGIIAILVMMGLATVLDEMINSGEGNDHEKGVEKD